MGEKNRLRKGLVVFIILLFISVSVLPSGALKQTHGRNIITVDNESDDGDYTSIKEVVLPTNSIHRCNLGYVSPVSMSNKQYGFYLEKSNFGATLGQTFTMNEPRGTDRGMGPIEVVSSECPGESSGGLMVIDSVGTIHVAWTDNTDYNGSGGDLDIFYKKKPVGGNWSSVEVVSTESAYPSGGTGLAVDSFGDVHVAWSEYNEFGEQKWYALYKMKPFGGNWSPAELIFPEVTWDYYAPSLACDAEGTVHMVWAANTSSGGLEGWDNFYRNKPRGGSWSPVEVITTGSKRCSDAPVLAVEPDGTVHVAWNENTGPFGYYQVWDVFYKKRASDGTWSAAKRISTEPLGWSMVSSLVVGPDRAVHIAWSVLRGGGSIFATNVFYRMKPYDGTWSRIERITTVIGAFGMGVGLAVGSDGTVHAVWMDIELWHWWGWPLIFYKNKPSGGAWTKHAEMVSIECTHMAFSPSIAIGPDESIVHIAWTDLTDYNGQGGNDADIVYRTKPVVENQLPTKPAVVGLRVIKALTNNTYEITSTDPDGDDVYYYAECMGLFISSGWTSDLLGPYNSGEKISILLPWLWSFIFIFKARAMDVNGAVGDWTKFVVIVLPANNDMNSEPTNNQQYSQNSRV
jgi:hypothetical protein